MGIISFAPAVRRGSPILCALVGESGSGKTLSALYIARGLVGPKGRIGMIDTETGRGLTYADDPDIGGYEYAELTPPFTPERYIEALKAAEDAGLGAVVLDSASHEWEGLGGVLEEADNARDSRGKPLQGLIKWKNPKTRHKRFVQALLNTRTHLVICLRAKEKLVQKRGEGGKEEIVSAGLVAVQDKRFIFEMTVQLLLQNLEPRGVPVIQKCPKGLLGAFGEGQRITVATGARVADWVNGGVPVDHAFQALKRGAEQAAEEGTVKLRDYWMQLGKDGQRQLKPFMDNLKSIAAEADREAAEEARRRAAAENGGEGNGDALDDPFGLPPLKEGEAA